VHPSLRLASRLKSRHFTRKYLAALLCAGAVLAAGCHRPGNISFSGIAWVTVTDEPGDFASYIVTIDDVTMTRNDGQIFTALATPEIVDFTKLNNVAELWGSAEIPDGTYTSVAITLDYTTAYVTVMVNGQPEVATVVDPTGASMTTITVTLDFDPANLPTITPTYASTSAQRLAIDFNLAASNQVKITAGVPTVVASPYVTAAIQAADTKLIRVRGPLINSSTEVGTYTVAIRPFYDEVNNLGTLTLFNTPTTVYTLNGKAYVGAAGLDAISLLSAGSTMTAGYTTFQPTFNTLNGATAGKFNMVYVVAGSTLEDFYTEGLEGDVIARSGNTLTLLGSTLILNTADTFQYVAANTNVFLGPGTLVTADDTTLSGLSSDSIGVGQHITARGIYGVTAAGIVTLDATGTSSTNTGSVRLQSTQLWGPLVSSAAGGLVMNLQTINDWPVTDYDFAGNGATTAQNPVPASFSVSTVGVPAPAIPSGESAGDPLWVNGIVSPFGSAPPDFDAFAVNSQASIQVAGSPAAAAGIQTCGVGSQVCVPASLQVIWNATPAAIAPFVGFSDAGFSINLTNASYNSGVIRIGPQSIDLKSLPASPQVVPTTLPVTNIFAPRYCVGNPVTSSASTTTTTTAGTSTTSTSTQTTAISVFSSYADFVTKTASSITATNPVLQLQATGVYNQSTNTFTATSIDLVL
jgi:hypothetical protein